MTTERLSILAAAAALREFTAPELADYIGANPSTVRVVLQREHDRRNLFKRTERRPSRGGRPAVVWQLEDADAIFAEITEEESRVAGLQGSALRREHQLISGSTDDRTDVYLTSAEEAVIRSYQTDDHNEQEALARIALNLLEAANPHLRSAEGLNDTSSWWRRGANFSQRHPILALASLETISRVRIGATLPPFNEKLGAARESNAEVQRLRAQRVGTFASISVLQARSLPIQADDLTHAAEAISEGSRILPVHQTLLWIKIFVNISIKSVNAPPVAVLTTAERSPKDLFPITRSDWRKLKAPGELANNGYVLWVEGWAESLLLSSLIPGVVVSHDDSPASNEALSQVMANPGDSVRGRAVVIASTVEDFRVVARVVASGGIYYPVQQGTADGLLPTVTRAVAEAVNSIPPDMALDSWTANVPRHLSDVYIAALSNNVIRAISPISIELSDLEITRNALAALETAIAAFRHLGGAKNASHSDLVDFFDNLSSQWPDPNRSSEAIAAVHASIDYYRNIVKLRSDLLDSTNLDALLAATPAERRQEAHEALAWAYEELHGHREPERPKSSDNPSLTVKDRTLITLLAAGKSIHEISDTLKISRSTAKRRVTSVLRKLGLETSDQIADWVARDEGPVMGEDQVSARR
jgi:DNA-binding CsgD family transcriptional regulator